MEKINNKIKLIIFPGNYLPHVGGLETHVDEFVKFLSKDKKYTITIFTPNILNVKENEIVHNNVQIIRYPAFFLISNFPFPKFWSYKFWKLFFNLYSENFNVVMTRTRFFSNTLLGLFFSKFRFNKLKLIHVEHGSAFVKLESKFKSFLAFIYDQIFGRLIFKFADKNIAISLTVQKFIYENFINSKNKEVSIIKRGIDFNSYSDIDENKIFSKKFKHKFILSYIGRLYKWKGVSNSIKAYLNLPKAIQSKCVLIIGGYGEDLDRLKKQSGEYLENGIFFLGKVPFGKNYELMKSSDVYLHSAYPGGGLSSTLLQYMFFKTAIIASPNEGANEVIFNGENGILMNGNSFLEIKKNIIFLFNNKSLIKKFSKNANHEILKNFNWRFVIKKYEKVFLEVLK